jgi:hypothetical protein
MNKILGILKYKKSYRKIDLNFKKRILSYNRELDKFIAKDVNLKDFMKEGKTLLLSPYPCKILF